MKPIEIGGTIILCFLMALAVMSGIGGGGIIVPLLMIFYNLDTKNAITVSGFTILTGAITRFAVTYKKRHPDKDATCIDYGITNIMMPLVLIGSICGVFANIIFPNVILLGFLTLLLAYLLYRGVLSFKSIWDKENEEKKKELEMAVKVKDEKTAIDQKE